jgi:hypothetical protein
MNQVMNQALQQPWPERARGGMRPAVIAWRERAARTPRATQAPRAPFRQRVAGWRARRWRRILLAWFVLSLAIMAIAAEPAAAFPRAQINSVPAVGMVLRVAGGLTVAGVPVVLVALP